MFSRNGVIPPYHHILNICDFIENKNKTNLIIIVFNIRLFSVFLRMEVARLLRLCLPFMVKSELSLLSIIKSQYRLYHHINSVSKCTNIIEISREIIPGYFNWTLSLNLGSKFIFKSETSWHIGKIICSSILQSPQYFYLDEKVNVNWINWTFANSIYYRRNR